MTMPATDTIRDPESEGGPIQQEWIAALGRDQGERRWQRVGTARSTGESEVYVVDIRASDLTADQTDNLRLAGPDGVSVQAGFPVMEATIDGELIRLRVAEFAAPAQPYLWRQWQQPTFLATALREGLSSLADAGLASDHRDHDRPVHVEQVPVYSNRSGLSRVTCW
jgi:hypothetical protein